MCARRNCSPAEALTRKVAAVLDTPRVGTNARSCLVFILGTAWLRRAPVRRMRNELSADEDVGNDGSKTGLAADAGPVR
jgi:hypothetical protein